MTALIAPPSEPGSAARAEQREPAPGGEAVLREAAALAASGGARRWRRFLLAVVGWGALAVGVLFALLVALDPYDRGGPALVIRPGIAAKAPRTANASRARDPGFDALVVGNSHSQLLKPERLDALTGLRFVQLATPGTAPREHLAMLAFALARGPPRRAIVIGTDETYCSGDPALPLFNPFPFWLYSVDAAGYLKGLLRFNAIEHLVDRLAFLAGRAAPAARDGYRDYEPERRRDPAYQERQIAGARAKPWHPGPDFPAIDRLTEALRAVPATTSVVLMVPPMHARALPPPGSPSAAAERACVARLAALAAALPRGALVDRRGDDAATRADLNFWDASHYAAPLARELEDRVAAAIGAGGG